MAYKIAVASSDGIHVDQSFGGASHILIYEVNEDGTYKRKEKRKAVEGSIESKKSCGCGKMSGGCGGGAESGKVRLVSDCRCVIAKKIGMQMLKQLEKKTIASFDVECGVEEALTKIIMYFQRVDQHLSLRGISKL